MKKVKETLNEKFEKDSDPIEDMGIGTCQKNVEKLREKLREMWDEYYEETLGDKDTWREMEVIEKINEVINELFGTKYRT
jgi:Skp family chaperone for outer membrane proteins